VTTTSSDYDKTVINEHSLLLGLWTRPSNAVRVSFDLELMSADRSFTRISPRQLQHYRIRASYKPADWMSFATSFNITEARNNVTEINHRRYNRSYSLSAMFAPASERWALDFAYDYNDIFSQTNICFVGTLLPPGTSSCSLSAALLQQISTYKNFAHFDSVNGMWKPMKRVTTQVGYTLVSTSGNTLILNPNAPPGTLAFNYHRPYGALAVALLKGLSSKAGWGYYGYNEKSPPDLTTALRDFRGNLVTVAIRYAF
jgi:hypothetical protein